MRDKYYVSRKQYSKMEALPLKGTKLYTAIKGFNLGGPSKTLLGLPNRCVFFISQFLGTNKILILDS